jgi:hypothetical protein
MPVNRVTVVKCTLTDDEATIISRHILELPGDIDLPSMQAPMLIGIIPPADVGVNRIAAPVQTLTCSACKKTPLLSQLFLCLSRACLGRMIISSIKWRKRGVFLPGAVCRTRPRLCTPRHHTERQGALSVALSMSPLSITLYTLLRLESQK